MKIVIHLKIDPPLILLISGLCQLLLIDRRAYSHIGLKSAIQKSS